MYRYIELTIHGLLLTICVIAIVGQYANVYFTDEVLKINGSIKKASHQYNLDPQLIESIIKVESNWEPNAISDKGAIGLMQLMPGTADSLNVNPWKPHENIIGGSRYLRKLINQFDGNLKLALAAYNAGPGEVKKYNGIPPYAETKQYYKDVLKRYQNKIKLNFIEESKTDKSLKLTYTKLQNISRHVDDRKN